MHSFVITSRNKHKREKYAIRICNEAQIHQADITFFNKDSFIKKDKKKQVLSIGIEDIKEIQKTLFLKPIQSEKKACIIQEAQLLTIEAQNSMLKILEEPPANTLIILTTDSKELLLPTILSRCQLIDISEKISLSDKELEKFQNISERLKFLSAGEGLALAETLAKNKEDAAIWLENMIHIFHKKIIEAVDKKDDEEKIWYAEVIRKFQNTYQIIKSTNINLRMTFENLFFSIIKKS